MLHSQFCQLGAHALAVLRAANEMDSTLLITGSTGTGKSHLAYSLHRASTKRANGRWYKVNLATLSENLIESELFGHERGAFTGADIRRVGRLESCNGGTVFLDEIGELPLRLQAKLLDFIQYKRVTPVGSNREIELDVRIIAATNRNLEAAVKAGEFRADLYHRLNVFHVKMPDLALNQKAVVSLARAILEDRARKAEKPINGFSRDVEHVFRHYSWPGNIRELENLVEFAVAMEGGNCIQLASMPLQLQDFARDTLKLTVSVAGTEIALPDEPISTAAPVCKTDRSAAGAAVAFLELPITMDFHHTKETFERTYLEQALRFCGGQINLTSRRIGLNKVSLTEKIKKYSIDWRKIRYESFGPALRPQNPHSVEQSDHPQEQ